MAVSTLPICRLVGFSGHRRLADPMGAARAIRDTVANLREESPGDWIGVSSIASGSDQLFVDQILALGLSWRAILPLPRAEFRKDFTPHEWAEAERRLQHADHVRVIPESVSREHGYLDCGIETVNDADVLIALWDGRPARGRGGTAEIVEYAAARVKPMIIIDAVTFAVRKINWTAVVDRNAELPRSSGG